MTAWQGGSRIRAAYLNPAMVAVVLAAAADGYARDAREAMSWPLAFLAAPLVLHKSTRQALPSRTSTHLPTWLSRNPLLHAGIAPRAVALRSTVTDGMRFGVRHGLLSLESGRLHGAAVSAKEAELRSLISSSTLVGRWFAKTGQPSTVFVLLGVEP